nr:MAG TPA: hypothetical protein [Caudoviricetes sp.]
MHQLRVCLYKGGLFFSAIRISSWSHFSLPTLD